MAAATGWSTRSGHDPHLVDADPRPVARRARPVRTSRSDHPDHHAYRVGRRPPRTISQPTPPAEPGPCDARATPPPRPAWCDHRPPPACPGSRQRHDHAGRACRPPHGHGDPPGPGPARAGRAGRPARPGQSVRAGRVGPGRRWADPAICPDRSVGAQLRLRSDDPHRWPLDDLRRCGPRGHLGHRGPSRQDDPGYQRPRGRRPSLSEPGHHGLSTRTGEPARDVPDQPRPPHPLARQRGGHPTSCPLHEHRPHARRRHRGLMRPRRRRAQAARNSHRPGRTSRRGADLRPVARTRWPRRTVSGRPHQLLRPLP